MTDRLVANQLSTYCVALGGASRSRGCVWFQQLRTGVTG